jgi:hypothetical protein
MDGPAFHQFEQIQLNATENMRRSHPSADSKEAATMAILSATNRSFSEIAETT